MTGCQSWASPEHPLTARSVFYFPPPPSLPVQLDTALSHPYHFNEWLNYAYCWEEEVWACAHLPLLVWVDLEELSTCCAHSLPITIKHDLQPEKPVECVYNSCMSSYKNYFIIFSFKVMMDGWMMDRWMMGGWMNEWMYDGLISTLNV